LSTIYVLLVNVSPPAFPPVPTNIILSPPSSDKIIYRGLHGEPAAAAGGGKHRKNYEHAVVLPRARAMTKNRRREEAEDNTCIAERVPSRRRGRHGGNKDPIRS